MMAVARRTGGVLFLVLLAAGCGGGDGGTPDAGTPVTVTSLSTIVGSYTLVDFLVEGSACGGTLGPSDSRITSWSGSMTISSSGQWTQTITINGQTATASQQVAVIAPNTIETTSEGGCTYTAGFEYTSTGRLTTQLAEGTCGAPCAEIDVWQRGGGSTKPAAEGAAGAAAPAGGLGVEVLRRE